MEASQAPQQASPFARQGRAVGRAEKRWPRLEGNSESVRRLEDNIARVATFDCSVLITGETGCGKEEVARAIHAAGPRHDKPFVAINCGGLVADLAESQLFGHEKGAFTGAFGASRGAFRAAEGGIIFLDEIGELPLDLQPKLLRVLQQREVLPVGATEPVPIDVQVVAATNRDLEAEVEKGTFREDLYYRLNMIELKVPALRERSEDIPEFIEFFSRQFAARYRLPVWTPSRTDPLARVVGILLRPLMYVTGTFVRLQVARFSQRTAVAVRQLVERQEAMSKFLAGAHLDRIRTLEYRVAQLEEELDSMRSGRP
jgi:DNA-binding NtrC family response regulator